MAVRLLTLGSPHCYVGDEELPTLSAQRLRCALLAYLAVEGTTSRESLSSVFWPDRDPERARHALSQNLYELRRALGEDWLDVQGDRLRVTPALTLDAREFEATSQHGDPAAALALYAGPFLDGFHLPGTPAFQFWVDRQRARLARLHRQARRAHVAALMEAHDLHAALAEARRWIELEPLEDEAQHRMVELLALTGQRAEAIRHFETYERLLAEEELEPLDETRALVEQIRGARSAAGDVAAERAGPAPATPRPSGAPASAGAAGVDYRRPSLATPGALSAAGIPGATPPPATRGPAAAAAMGAATSPSASPTPVPAGTEDAGGFGPELEVVRLLGEGSAARVYLAREPALGRLVAVKLLAPALAGDETARLRFEREAQAAARIQHPNVATVFRIGRVADGAPFLVLPYMAGGSLEDRMAAAGPPPLPEARRWIAQLAAGLAAAHRLDIVHRDVRPANILYDRETDRLLLTDFGIAAALETGAAGSLRLTRPGERLGNPAYASPEQLRGEPVTERADVYSLGIVAFQLLTGRLPFEAETPLEMAVAHATREPPRVSELRAGVDAELEALVGRCLNKRPEQRPFAGEVAEGVGAA